MGQRHPNLSSSRIASNKFNRTAVCTCNFIEQNRKIMTWLHLSASMTYYSSLRVLLFYFVILKIWRFFFPKKLPKWVKFTLEKHIFLKKSYIFSTKFAFLATNNCTVDQLPTLPQWTSTQQDTIHCIPNAHSDSLCGWISTELISVWFHLGNPYWNHGNPYCKK
jgi:hypothetical protein